MYRDTEGRLHLSRRDAIKIAGATFVGTGLSLAVPNSVVDAIAGVNCDETPTSTPTEIPLETPTPTKTEKPTETPCPTDTPEPTITNTPTETASETPTVTASPTVTETPTNTATTTETPVISVTPSITPTETATPVVSITPSPTGTSTSTEVIPPTKTKQVNPPSGTEGIISLPVKGKGISNWTKLAIGATLGFMSGVTSVATGKIKEEPTSHDVLQNPPKQTE